MRLNFTVKCAVYIELKSYYNNYKINNNLQISILSSPFLNLFPYDKDGAKHLIKFYR